MRLDYLKLTLKHKWYVLKAGLKLGVPLWQLLRHDTSKLGRTEYTHYQRWFFEDKNDPIRFAQAWLHHQNSNPHHWEYWISRTPHKIGAGGDYIPTPLPIPERYVREMVADWVGAGLAYTGKMDVQEWLNKNYHKMCLHQYSKLRIHFALKEFDCFWPGDFEE